MIEILSIYIYIYLYISQKGKQKHQNLFLIPGMPGRLLNNFPGFSFVLVLSFFIIRLRGWGPARRYIFSGCMVLGCSRSSRSSVLSVGSRRVGRDPPAATHTARPTQTQTQRDPPWTRRDPLRTDSHCYIGSYIVLTSSLQNVVHLSCWAPCWICLELD